MLSYSGCFWDCCLVERPDLGFSILADEINSPLISVVPFAEMQPEIMMLIPSYVVLLGSYRKHTHTLLNGF